jgi:target of EGR1 protein 1
LTIDCNDGALCTRSHDLNLIIEYEFSNEHQRKKLKPTPKPITNPLLNKYTTTTPTQDHSSYFDAYMTAFIFAHQLIKHDYDFIKNTCRNRVYLVGKQIPLIIEKSRYAKTSEQHQLKMRKRDLLLKFEQS